MALNPTQRRTDRYPHHMEEFTASDVRARTFRLTLRGFDRGEVEDYLEQVAAYVGALLQQLHRAGVTELEARSASRHRSSA